MNNKNKLVFIIICLLITTIYVPVYITHANPLDNTTNAENVVEDTNTVNESKNSTNVTNTENKTNVASVENKTNITNTENKINTTNTESNTSVTNNEKNTIKENNENKVQNNIDLKSNTEITNTNQEILENGINQVFYESESTEPVQSISTTEATIKAKLFDTNQYTDGVELTSEGITINDWQYSTSKYLQIDPLVPEDDNDYIISIELPKELYFVCDEIPLPTGYSKFEFTKNASIDVNLDSKYNLNQFSGKIEYYMSPSALSGTIQLEIRYDNVLWNKAERTLLTAPGDYPVTVKLIKVNTDGVSNDISELKVSQAYSKSKFPYSTLMYYKTSTDVSENASSVSVMTVEKTLSIRGNFYFSNDAECDFYFDTATIEIQMPYYTDENGNKYYLNVIEDRMTFPSAKNPNYIITYPEEGKMCITFSKYYIVPNRFILLYFSGFPQELLEYEQDEFVFSKGYIKLKTKTKDNSKEISVYSMNMVDITYQKEGNENLNLTTASSTINVGEDKPKDAISLLGSFRIKNSGSKNSCEKEIFIEFDINNTNVVQVTSMRLPIDTSGSNFEIEYSMVDELGNIVFFDENGNPVNSTIPNATTTWKTVVQGSKSGCVLFARHYLAESHRNLYFKTIKYNIKTILAGQALFTTQNVKSVTSAGNFLGYTNGCMGSVSNIYHKMTINSIDDPSIASIAKNVQTVTQTNLNSGYYLENVKFDKESIIAGDHCVLSGEIKATEYPYGNATWLKEPIIGLVLPNGISVNPSAVLAKTSNGYQISNITVSSEEIENGNKLWRIKLPSDCYFGYYTETYSALSPGAGLIFNIQLDTSYTMNNTAFFVTNMYLTGKKQVNACNGSYAWTSKVDTYDLNENGSTADKISGLKSSDTTNCQIIAQSATLDLQSSINLNSSGNIGQETTNISTLTKDDTIIYNLDINCNNGGRAEEFIGFIPIPKLNSGRDEYLITSQVENSFDLALQDFAAITGSDKYNIQYSFEPNLTYAKAKEATTWYTKEDIENNSDLNIQDITMIKLTVKDGTLENGDSTRITVNMKYNGTDYINEVGAKNSWHSAFFYNYINNDRISSGTYTSPKVQAQITHTEELQEVTLTAAKDMAPINPDNINEMDINYRSLKNIHNLSITNVETYNVALKTKEYILSNTDMPGIESNESFAITIKMSGGTEKNITEDVLKTPLSIGTLNSNEELNYKLKIYNADSLTDNSLARYIIITLKSDNGITFKQKININRELSQATDPQSAIVEGKRYINFDDITSEINLSQDSALTAQFVINYIPSLYNEQKLQFSNELPINTYLTLVNLTENSNVKYYYYKVDNKISELDLNNFIMMGKTNTNYEYPTIDKFIDEKLLIIMDFSKCTEYLESETNVKLIMSGNLVDDVYSKELKFTTHSKRNFELLVNNSNVNVGEDIQINYNLSTINASESNYLGRKLALVIKTPTNIPIDSYIISNNIKYNLNSNKEFIIPLTEVQNGSGQVELSLNTNMDFITESIYECKIELWVSATSNAQAPKLGEKLTETTMNFKYSGKLNPSLKIIDLENRAIRKSDIENVNQLVFEMKNSTETIVEIELQQKIGTAYQKLTNVLNQVNNITEHNMGVFTINAIEGNNTVNINLSPAIESGTYRFVIKVKDKMNNKLLEVPYNFVVLDE